MSMMRTQYCEEATQKNDKDSKLYRWESVRSINEEGTGAVNNNNNNDVLTSSNPPPPCDSGVDNNSQGADDSGC